MIRVDRGLVVGLLLATGAATASAAILKVPAQFPTIQAAIDAAAPGDTIKLDGIEFRESITVDVENLTVLGKCSANSPTIIDGGPSGNGDVVTVNAASVTLACLLVRHGDDGIRAVGSGVTVSRTTVTDPASVAVFVDGDGFLLDQVDVLGAGDACIEVEGDGGQVVKSNVRNCSSNGIAAECDGCLFEKNTITGCSEDGSGHGFYIEGDRNVVDANVVTNTYYSGLYFDGNENLATGNLLDGAAIDSASIYLDGNDNEAVKNTTRGNYYEGVYVDGDRNRVADNEIHTFDDDAVEVFGNDTVIVGNKIDSQYGIDCNGDNCLIENNVFPQVTWTAVDVCGANPRVIGNEVHGKGGYGHFEIECGTGTCPGACMDGVVRDNVGADSGFYDEYSGFYIEVSSMEIANNVSDYSNYFGFEIYCDGCTIHGNSASRNGGHEGSDQGGFYVEGDGNEVYENESLENHGVGFRTSGTGNVFWGNLAQSNSREGFLVEGMGHRLDGNTAVRNHAEGIDNASADLEAIDNVSEGNRTDCTNDATLDPGSGGNTCADGSDFGVASEI